MIPVSGHNYLPFLRLAHGFSIPWFILSDGEANTIAQLKKALAAIKIADYAKAANVQVFPSGYNNEQYILSLGYQDAVCDMLKTLEGPDFLSEYLRTQHGQPGKKNVPKDYQSANGKDRALLDILTEKKTACAALLARTITSLPDERRHQPALIKKLFDGVSDKLRAGKA